MSRIQTVAREERFTLLLTVAERAEIDRAATQTGLDRSSYVRSVLFGRMQPAAAKRDSSPGGGSSAPGQP
jgi:hypothetical protein